MDNSSRALVVWTAVAGEILAFLLPSWLSRMDVVLLTESRPLAWRRRRSLGYLLRINWAVRLFIAQCYRSEHGPSLLFGVVTQLQAPAASRPHDTGIWCLRVLLHRTAAPTALPAQGPLAWETATLIQSQWGRLGVASFHLLLLRADGTCWRSVAFNATAWLTLAVDPDGPGLNQWTIRWFRASPAQGVWRASDSALAG